MLCWASAQTERRATCTTTNRTASWYNAVSHGGGGVMQILAPDVDSKKARKFSKVCCSQLCSCSFLFRCNLLLMFCTLLGLQWFLAPGLKVSLCNCSSLSCTLVFCIVAALELLHIPYCSAATCCMLNAELWLSHASHMCRSDR